MDLSHIHLVATRFLHFFSMTIVPNNLSIHDLNANFKRFLLGMVLVGQFKRYAPWGSQKFTGDH